MLEHSVLAPGASRAEVVAGVEVARRLNAGVMMVAPCWLETVVAELAGCGTIPASVLAFPHGTSLPEAKASEAERLARLGARELDMVMNVGRLKSGEFEAVRRDIAGVVAAAGAQTRVKVILETCLLTDAEIVAACKISEDAGAAYVKTSTGFSSGGATAHAVALMRASVGAHTGVKASGGIRTLADARAMIEAGATRIGTSATERILDELEN